MAGRGRGRGGRGRGFTFDIGALGLGRGGDALPASILQPPPLYPALEVKPLPLNDTEADDYLLSLKQEFRGCMRGSSYFIKPETIKKDIERFSDRHKEKANTGEGAIEWQPDWKLFPAELKIRVRKRGPSRGRGPRLVERPAKRPKQGSQQGDDVVKQLDSLFQEVVEKEKVEEEKKDEAEDEDEFDDDEDDYDEEEQEEENDYLVSHFDDDDDYGFLDEDDMDEGPTY